MVRSGLNCSWNFGDGQPEEITCVHDDYPHLHDDAFVIAHLAEWLERMRITNEKE